MARDIVYAVTTGTASWNGQRVQIAQDDPWWADDPFVKAHPQHFAARPLRVFGAQGADVEQATAAPGEKRTAKRAGR